jgi:hypothetical protein
MKSLQSARSLAARSLVAAVLLGGLVLVGGGVVAPACAVAQNTQRSVQGRVVNASDTPIPGAIVYLSNARTMTVESYITQQDGAYRFEQLAPDDDYKLWAQVDGRKSKVKTLSSFDDRSVFHVILKIGTGK